MNTANICGLMEHVGPLTENGRQILFFLALGMMGRKQRQHVLVLHRLVVVIHTDYEEVPLGEGVGVKFRAGIISDQNTLVDYVVRRNPPLGTVFCEALSEREAELFQGRN
jgi:hypothetical protein